MQGDGLEGGAMNAMPEFVEGQEGVFYDLADADYRKAPGVSNSMLKAICADGDEPGSPAHFIAQFSTPVEDTDALFLGRQIHSRILTPDAPLPGVIEIPEVYTNEKGEVKPWSGNAKVCKAFLEKAKADGLRPLKKEQIESIDGIVNAIAAEPTCQIAFRDGKSEVSLFKRYYRGGGTVLRKARLDWVPPGKALVDLKTCLDARECEFAWTLWKRRYFVQADFYLSLWNELNPDDQKTDFVFIAVEKFPPYAISLFRMDRQDLQSGRREWQRNIHLLMECQKTGEWPSYPSGVRDIKMRVPQRVNSVLPD